MGLYTLHWLAWNIEAVVEAEKLTVLETRLLDLLFSKKFFSCAVFEVPGPPLNRIDLPLRKRALIRKCFFKLSTVGTNTDEISELPSSANRNSSIDIFQFDQ